MPKQPFSTEELALLHAIHDDPRNDRLRLDYSDWLEANGLPGFAEFIRIQCSEPYFVLTMGPAPRVDTETYWIEYDDPTRANRAIELLKPLYNSDHFPLTQLFEQVIRGLPCYEDEQIDANVGITVDSLYPELSPLARFRLSLRTTLLEEWLKHPLMRFVDILRIFPESSFDPDDDELPKFTIEDILLLEQAELLDRLDELGLCAHMEDEVRQLAEDRLRPRVPISYDY